MIDPRRPNASDLTDFGAAFSAAAIATGVPAPKATVPTGIRGIHMAGSDRSVNATSWPTRAGMDYFISRGFNLFRFGTKWNCLQKPVNGSPAGQPLDPVNLAGLRASIEYVTSRGCWAIIDIHDYMLYDTTQNDAPNASRAIVGEDPRVSNAVFAAFWALLAMQFRGNPRVIFEPQNEPGGARALAGGAAAWAATAQAVITAIRATGALNPILVNNYAATDWDTNGNDVAMLTLVDPADNIVFAPHAYMDGAGGSQQTCVMGDGVYHLAQYVKWARDNGKRGLLGETGAGNNATCYNAIREMLDYVEGNTDVFAGWIWFGGYAGQCAYNSPDDFWLALDPDTYSLGSAIDDPRLTNAVSAFLTASHVMPTVQPVASTALTGYGAGAASDVASPDGTASNAKRLIENSATAERGITTPGIATASGAKYTLNVDVRRDAGTRDVMIKLIVPGSYDSTLAIVSLDTGKVSYADSFGGFRLTRPTVSVRQIDGHAWRVTIGTILFVANADASAIFAAIQPVPKNGAAASSTAYAGDGASGITVWNVKWKVQ